MLSLTAGNGATKIAVFDKSKEDKKPEKFIYIKEDDRHKAPEIETTQQKRLEILSDYLRRDKKLRYADIETLISAYKHNTTVPAKLERKYDDAKRYVSDSLKHYLDYPKDVELHPIIEQPTYRIFISGLSGSGKSTYIANFLKHNKPKHIFLMSPVYNYPAFKKLKPDPVHLNLATYSQEFEKEFEIEDFPEGSVVILDDVDTSNEAAMYQRAKVQLLERGRHLSVSTIVVSHVALAGSTRHAISQLLECEFYVIFPRSNKAHAEKLLKRYVGLGQEKCDLVLGTDSRAIMVKKSYPSYFIGSHTCGVLN